MNTTMVPGKECRQFLSALLPVLKMVKTENYVPEDGSGKSRLRVAEFTAEEKSLAQQHLLPHISLLSQFAAGLATPEVPEEWAAAAKAKANQTDPETLRVAARTKVLYQFKVLSPTEFLEWSEGEEGFRQRDLLIREDRAAEWQRVLDGLKAQKLGSQWPQEIQDGLREVCSQLLPFLFGAGKLKASFEWTAFRLAILNLPAEPAAE